MKPDDPNDGSIREGEPPSLGKRTERAGPRATLREIPVAASCPDCGCKEFRRVKVTRLVAFTDDRECAACGARYTPPTPVWAAVVFILLGVLITGVGVTGVGVDLFFAERGPVRALHLGIGAVITGIGLACAMFGIRSLSSQAAPGKHSGPAE